MTTKHHLITNHADRSTRIEAKRAAVLGFLAYEGYTTAPVLELLLGLQRNAVYRTLKAMERDGLVRGQSVASLGGPVTVWGLTPHGAIARLDPEAEDFNPTYFEPGRVSPLTVMHTIDVQRARLFLTAQGWTDWKTDRQLHEVAKAQPKTWLKVPDGFGIAPDGARVALEVERTFKTIKRYEAVMASYLQMVRAGTIDRVQYLCPTKTEVNAARMQRVFQSIKAVPVAGQRVELRPDHYARFSFQDITT
jgi:hypothetical protein